jgi:hypothetical protein
MAQVFKKVVGTTSPEFYIGVGDITVEGSNIVGLRSNNGIAEYKNAGGDWVPLSAGGVMPDSDILMVDDIVGNALDDDIGLQVLVNE